MKHAREDYSRIQDPSGLIPENEPVFLLRGQDVLAPKLLEEWADRLELNGGSKEMADLVRSHAKRMIEWQVNVKAKVPDLKKKA